VNPAVFASAKLWNPLPKPPSENESQVAKEEPKPLRLELIGIIREGGTWRAAVYDKDHDQLLIVGSGETIHQYQVTKITSGGIELSDGRSTQRLDLQESSS
jgi:hypothetical protein